MGMKNHNLAFIDIETTGLVPATHEVIEIGAVITDPDFNVIEEFEIKIKPERIEMADLVALKVNQYQESEWASARPLPEAMEIFSQKIKDCIMVGHNVAFDFGFLDYAFAKVGIPNTLHYHKLDTVSIAWAKLHREPDLDHFSLRELCLRFGIKNERAHTGLSDARATFELYKKLMEL